MTLCCGRVVINYLIDHHVGFVPNAWLAIAVLSIVGSRLMPRMLQLVRSLRAFKVEDFAFQMRGVIVRCLAF
jgi:hypothetical protein